MTDKKGKGVGLNLSNISLVKNKIPARKNDDNSNDGTKIKPIEFKVDKYYKDKFIEFTNMYFASGISEPYNRTYFFKKIVIDFFENNIDTKDVTPISDSDYFNYVRLGRRRKVTPYKNELGGKKMSIFLNITPDFKRETISNIHHYYGVKENLKNLDVYSIAYFFRDLIVWLESDKNFTTFVLNK
ncbi:MAG: hypothetical protein ACPGSD_17335 [Flavobacteriales bacterium]|jgi:hypothetical protein